MPLNVSLISSTSLITNYSSTISVAYQNLQLGIPAVGRVLYLKEASEVPGPPVFSIQPYSTIQGSTLLYLNKNESLLLQAYTRTDWGILGGYQGISTFSTQVLPVNSVVIEPSFQHSHIFVDLRTQSKTILLPPIETLPIPPDNSPFYTIKDLYGNAAISTLYLSTSINNTLERSSINNAIGIKDNYGSIDLAANRSLAKWHILNYYNGSLVSNP